MTEVQQLANEFSKLLRDTLTAEQMSEVVRLNKTIEYSNGGCAAQDLCDANQVMIDAFTKIYGREPALSEEPDFEMNFGLMDKAYTLARNNDFLPIQ